MTQLRMLRIVCVHYRLDEEHPVGLSEDDSLGCQP